MAARVPTMDIPWSRPMLPAVLREEDREQDTRGFRGGGGPARAGVRPAPSGAGFRGGGGPVVRPELVQPGESQLGRGTAERFRGDVARAWAQVGAEPEEMRLPGAWGRAVETLRGGVSPAAGGQTLWESGAGPGPVAELQDVDVRKLWESGAGRLEGMTPEQERDVAQRVGAVLGLPGAAWQSAKQLPVVGPPLKVAGALGGTALAALTVPTTAMKETISQVGQRLPGGMGLMPFDSTQHLSAEQEAEAKKIAEDVGMPLGMARQGVLLSARQGQLSIRQYARETFGEGPELETALSRLGAGMGYSSYEAQRNALDRLMGGESMAQVTGGRQVNTWEPSEEEKKAVEMYVEGVRQRDGDDAARAALVSVQESGLIPGESDLWNEALFEFGLDPLNIWDLGAIGRVKRAREAVAAGRFTEAVADVSRVADDVADGIRRGLVRGGEEGGLLGRLWGKVNPLALTPQSQADDLAGLAYQVVSPAVMQVDSADEAAAIVRAMVDDPAAMRGVLGNVPVSQAAEEMRPVLAAVVAEDLDNFTSLRRGEGFSRVEFLSELDGAVAVRAAEAAGVAADAERTGYQKFAAGYKNLMSEFHLRTPGYAARNAIGDLVTMGWDGLMSFDGRGAIDNFFERVGPTTRRVSEARRAGAQVEVGAQGSRLPGILGRASGRVGDVISAQEEARYTRAFYTGMQRYLGENWVPLAPDDLRGLLGDDAARAIERGMANAVNEAERALVIERALGDGGQQLVDLSQYVDDPNVLSVGLRLELENRLSAGEVVDDVIDDLSQQVRARAGQSFATDPIPPGRRWSSDAEAYQDLSEEQGWLEALGKRMGVGAEETAAAADELAEALRPGEVAIREETAALGARVAQGIGEGGDVRQGGDMMRYVRAKVGKIKREARAASDQLRAAAWEETLRLQERGQSAKMVWAQYHNENEALRLAEQQKVLGILTGAGEQWERLAAGEEWMDVIGSPMERVIEESLASLRSDLAGLTARQKKWARLGIADFGDFDSRLDAHRLGVDLAEQEAWRLLAINPSRDGLDIVTSTQEAVDSAARAVVNEVAASRIAVQMGKRSPAQHAELADELWGKWFGDASHRFDLARVELSELPLDVAGQQRALRALGWPDEAVGKLRPDQVQAVLGAGVRWDAMLDAPVISLEEAMRGSLAEIAGVAGLDLTRAADWTPAQWDEVEMAARQMAREAQDRASTANRITAAGLELAGEVAEGAPRTVAAGMEIVWPQSVDDVARMRGMRPQQMSPEDWEEVAQFVDTRRTGAEGAGEADVGNRWLEMAEEARQRAGLPALDVGAIDARRFTSAEDARNWAQQAWAEQIKSLSSSEKGVFPLYSGYAFEALNDYLRDPAGGLETFWVDDTLNIYGGNIDDWLSGRLKNKTVVEKITGRMDAAILKSSSPTDLIVYRGMGMSGRGSSLIPGSIFSDPGYVSTSLLENSALLFTNKGGYVARILVPEGNPALYMGNLAAIDVRDELEVLLPRNSRFRVVGSTPAEGYTIIDMELIGDVVLPAPSPQPTQYVINPPGQYDAAGFPVVREQGPRPMVSQRDRVELAAGMVPEAERIGRGGATVGFEARQAQLVTRYDNLAEMAKARAALKRSGRHIYGEAMVIPGDVSRVRYRKEAGHYVLDLLDEDGVMVRDYWFGDYGAMRRARVEAEEVIRAGQQGQQAATMASADAWGSEDVLRAGKRAAANGYSGGPTLADAARVQMDEELEALENIRYGMGFEQGAGEVFGETLRQTQGDALPPIARRRLMEWAESLDPEWENVRARAVDVARAGADEALLNYGSRRRGDEWLAMVFPYSYWKTRSARNWLLRAAQRPAAVAGIARAQRAQERANVERGYRGRFEGGVEVPVPGMPEWMGEGVFVNPLQMLVPWAQIMGPEWVGDPGEGENLLDAAYITSQRLGLRPYGFIEWPLKYAGWIGQGREDIGNVLPHTGAVQAATAMMGVGGPGGISLEGGLRRGVGLPEQEPFGAYRVQREISNMAADIMADEMRRDPRAVQTGMVAQELQRLVVAGELDLRGATRWEGASQGPVERVAQAQGWSGEQLLAGQEMLREAVRRAAVEKGIGTLSSFFAGVPARIYPSGERQQVELEREQRGRQYSELTGQGSRAGLQAFREEHPEAVLRRLARSGLPGEAVREEAWTPGEAWQSEEYRSRAAEVERTYSAAIEESLRTEPWNRDAVRELEAEMQGELDVLRDEVFPASGNLAEGGTSTYRLRSVYGASPEEEGEIRREEVLAAVSAAMPRAGEFVGAEGEVDYDAYERAVGEFFRTLPERMAGDDRLGAIARAMRTEVGGVDRRPAGRTLTGLRAPVREERTPAIEELLGGVTREEVTRYWTRNDTPLEALQRVYEDTVYARAWDEYSRAVNRGMDKGDAYEQYIEGARGRDAGELIGAVMEAYPERWTEEELGQAFEGVDFPDVGEISLLRKPEEEQRIARGQGAFWDFLNEGIPPGKMSRGARDYTLVQLVLDAETRGTVTAEQYEQALSWLEEWRAENKSEEWLTPADWAEARALNDEFDGMLEQWLPGIKATLGEYYDLSQAKRRGFKAAHPEIGEYFDARDWFGEQDDNALWAYFYLGKALGTAAVGADLGERASGGRRYYGRGRRRYGGGGRGRGGRRGVRDRDFRYQAGRVPRADLKRVGPWDSALRFEKYRARGLGPEWKRYKAQGVPWLMGKWRR